jgi:hypothetical protein
VLVLDQEISEYIGTLQRIMTYNIYDMFIKYDVYISPFIFWIGGMHTWKKRRKKQFKLKDRTERNMEKENVTIITSNKDWFFLMFVIEES